MQKFSKINEIKNSGNFTIRKFSKNFSEIYEGVVKLRKFNEAKIFEVFRLYKFPDVVIKTW
jgi:hypothetical protein